MTIAGLDSTAPAAMPPPRSLAIGIGCRRDCPGEAIASLVLQALAALPPHIPRALFTIAAKLGQAGPRDAAGLLGLALYHLPRDSLAAAMPRVQTRSARALDLFGVASVAEASALAGAGAGGRLIVPRIARDGATCAIAGDFAA